MITAEAARPTATAKRTAVAMYRFRAFGTSVLLFIRKRAHGISAHEYGQSSISALKLLTAIYLEDACVQWLPAVRAFWVRISAIV